MIRVTKNYFLRILPSGEVQRWVSVDDTDATATATATDLSCTCCGHRTRWVAESRDDLRAAVAALASREDLRPADAGPCRCIVVRGVTVDDGPEELGQAEEVRFDAREHKPFGIAFSWTCGLDWDAQIELRSAEGGRVEVLRHGKLLATTRHPVDPNQHEQLRQQVRTQLF
jgi:hypothetical protein